MLDDDSVLARLANGLTSRASDQRERGWTAHVVGIGDRQVDLELVQDGASARVWISLPESLRPTPWLVEWEPADDPDAWVRQLTAWLDEEMCTGGLGPAHALILEDHEPRLVVDGYGLRLADEGEHRRLRRIVGPHGWHTP